MKPIYLDNNGTTPIDPRVIEAMVEELHLGPSNPSSIHAFGRAAKNRLQRSRELVANHLHEKLDEIVFTSSGTEALNLAILGMQTEGKILSTRIEHAAVYKYLKHQYCLAHIKRDFERYAERRGPDGGTRSRGCVGVF